MLASNLFLTEKCAFSVAQTPNGMLSSPRMLGAEARPTSSLAEFLAQKFEDPKLLSSPQAASYLAYISSLPLPSVLAEPQNLATETTTLTSQLTSLCTAEYSTFLALHSASSALADSLNSFSSSLDSLLESIPSLESETQTFSTSTKTIQSQRRKATLVLEQHDKLLDVLQIPQLIDTCVRNGYYAEALDLSTHASSLVARFPTIPVIVDIASEAEQAIRLMSIQLLALLREPAKLPALFKAVNFLRRMGTLDEEELSLAYLTGREVYLAGVFGSIEQQRSDPSRYLKKYVDIFREGVHDVISQYASIFLDKVSNNSNRSSLHLTLLHFLHSYIHTHVTRLMDLLRETIPKIDDPASVTSLLTQLTYCATSFSRVGLDFRSLLEAPFTEAVLSRMTVTLSAAFQEFQSQVNKNANKLASNWLVTPSTLASLPYALEPAFDESTPVHVAPPILSSFPPFAVYTNAMLSALNSLRQLSPLSIYSSVYTALEGSLAEVGRGLLDLAKSERKENTQEKEVEDRVFVAAGIVYLKCLIPFALRALREGVYGIKEYNQNKLEKLETVRSEWEDWLSLFSPKGTAGEV